MTFSNDELQMIVDSKIDKIVFKSGDKEVFMVDLDLLIRKRIATDPNLKKQLVTQVLQSEG